MSPFRGESKIGVHLFRNVLLLFWIKLRENKTCMTCSSATSTGKLRYGRNACGISHAKASAVFHGCVGPWLD